MIINKNQFNFLIFLICLLFIAGCTTEKTQVHHHQLFVFGTLVDINIWHHDQVKVSQVINEISETFNQMHHQWHAWKPGRLQQINQQLQQGNAVQLTEKEAAFIQQTLDYSKASDYQFDPTIGKIINLWGFHTDEYPITTPPPDEAVIKALINTGLSVEALQLKQKQLLSTNSNVWLDFGGIAKGYAIDIAVEILHQHEIHDAIINAGGDLRSIGSKGNKAWRVAIQSPKDWSTLADFEVLHDEAVFTSGNYQRYKEFDGKRYAHIIDPRTGMPVNEIVSATVVTSNGIKADAAATALVVAGDQWFFTAKAMGIDQALVINEQHQCQVTRALFQRLENLTIDCQVID